MNLRKYCARGLESEGMSVPTRPLKVPYIDPFVFIHAGGLHGFAMNFSEGLSASACLSTGMIYAISCLMEDRANVGSVWPGGRSSYEYGPLTEKSEAPIGIRTKLMPMPLTGSNKRFIKLSRWPALI